MQLPSHPDGLNTSGAQDVPMKQLALWEQQADARCLLLHPDSVSSVLALPLALLTDSG